jgi:hypothetical protein
MGQGNIARRLVAKPLLVPRRAGHRAYVRGLTWASASPGADVSHQGVRECFAQKAHGLHGVSATAPEPACRHI